MEPFVEKTEALMNFLEQEFPISSVVPRFPQNHMEMIEITRQREKQKRRDTLNFTEMSDNELQEFKQDLEDTLDKIKSFRKEKFEKEYFCSFCKKEPKNIGIVGCFHLDLCESCEKKLVVKKCPRCLKPYDEIIKVSRN